MILEFTFLGAFESIKLFKREKVAVIIRTGVDENPLGNNIIFDAGHGSLTNRTGNGRGRRN